MRVPGLTSSWALLTTTARREITLRLTISREDNLDTIAIVNKISHGKDFAILFSQLHALSVYHFPLLSLLLTFKGLFQFCFNCKYLSGHAAYSHEILSNQENEIFSKEKQQIFLQENTQNILPVPNKTESDEELELRDEENNRVQREILDAFNASRSNNHSGPKSFKNDPSLRTDAATSECCTFESNETVSHTCLGSNPLNRNDYFDHEMELILFEENQVSEQMTILEHRIREKDGEESQEELLSLWFELISKKNVVFHRRLMLEILQNEEDLERKYSLLQTELRKTDLEPAQEELLLKELLLVVDARDKVLTEKNDEENLLCQEENIGRNFQHTSFQTSDEKQKCCIQ